MTISDRTHKIVALGAFAIAFSAGVASLQTAAKAETNATDCAGAAAAMQQMHPAQPSTLPPATSTDKTFAAMMMAHDGAMIAMAKLELKCGANDKAKALAKQFIDSAAGYEETMNLILHTP